jgi:hypothetical protein
LDHTIKSTLFNELSSYIDKEEILVAIITQLEKDTGLDYTQVKVDLDNPYFLDLLRRDLAAHIQKIASQNHTRFMHLIYRVDITQTKMNKLDMDEFYFVNLAELILNRMFQKIITKKFIK